LGGEIEAGAPKRQEQLVNYPQKFAASQQFGYARP